MLSSEWQWLLGQIQTPNQLAELIGVLHERVKKLPFEAGLERLELVRVLGELHSKAQRFAIAHQREVVRRNMAQP